MDALSVLSVVAATLQFVDFSTKLISRTFTIYTSSSGALYEHKGGATITESLLKLNKDIKTSTENAILPREKKEDAKVTNDTDDIDNIGIIPAWFQPADDDERALIELCNGCNAVAEKLLAALRTLELSKTNRKEWESLRIALKSIWSNDALEELERCLSAYRQQISLHILWGMRKQLEGGLQNLKLEQRQTRSEIVQLVGERDDWKESVIAAIATSPLLGDQPDDLKQGRFVQLILRDLHFDRISNREERIPRAHEATFQWVFMPPRTGQPSWADFGEWLESDSSMYWITGKPGSGKSTLMKFIGNDARTTLGLTKSAAGRRLVIASYYFWNSGVELQMTQEGLLRTLTYNVLQQCNDLAIKAFPRQWELFQLFGIFDSEPLEYHGLQRQLDLIIEANPSTQFVFFIDGLDEFIGNRSDLAAYVKRLSDGTNTKVCASSRPWNEFEDAFASTPSLRVEDLTYPDVVRFIESNFNESPGYAELRAESQSEADDLLHAIASKASGVFLWVSLVVKSLLSGLTNGERLSKLRRRLDALPPDLEQLFQGMLDQIVLEDREDASKLFQIVRAAFEPPTIMTLAWADEDPNLPFTQAVKPLSAREMDAKSRRMRRRLRSHCRGLLEEEGSSWSEGTVEFLHRTVRDFLYRDEVWSKLQSYTSTSFHPEQALCRSYVLQLKCVNGNLGLMHGSIDLILRKDDGFRAADLLRLISPFVWYTHKLHEKTGDAQLQLYDELEKAIKTIFVRGNSCPSAGGFCWCEGPADHDGGPFLSLAIAFHIIPYLEARLQSVPIRENRGRGLYSMLQEAVLYAIDATPKSWERAICYREDESQLLKLLLARGADPNFSTEHQSTSPWEEFTHSADWNLSARNGATPDMFRQFLHHGADPKVNLSFLRDEGPEWKPVLELQKKKQRIEKMKDYISRIRRLRLWD